MVSQAKADLPSRDPAVRELRERFKAARAPTLEDLELGRYWTCKYLSATPDSRLQSTFPKYYKFLRTEGPNFVGVEDDSQQVELKLKRESLHIRYEFGGRGKTYGYDHVRVGPEGELLVEWAAPNCTLLTCVFFTLFQERSVEKTFRAAVGYRECRLGY